MRAWWSGQFELVHQCRKETRIEVALGKVLTSSVRVERAILPDHRDDSDFRVALVSGGSLCDPRLSIACWRASQ